MTTVAELRKFLEQFPDDTNVEVVRGFTGRNYDGDEFVVTDFDPTEDVDVREYATEARNWTYTPSWSNRPGNLLLGADN